MGCAFKNSTSIRDRTFDPLRRYVRSPPEKSPAIADRFANRSMAVLASVAGAKIAPPWLASWREASGGAQCGKSACCVRRGGDWKRGTVERPAGAPVLDPTDVAGTGNVARSR